MNRGKTGIAVYLLLLAGLCGFCCCGSPASDSGVRPQGTGTEQGGEGNSGSAESNGPELIYESRLELQYAENFSVDYYQGGYVLLTLKDASKFLVVPEGKAAPENREEGITVLQRPLNHLYLVASAAMSMFCELDALDTVALSGQKVDGWYIEEAKAAMENGNMVYAGKYNKPDYELILSRNCMLAIENMMISHAPKVVEKLEGFGIPVMIDYSSYETHPMGRVEWIKFYGALLGKEEPAMEAFAKQEAILKQVEADEKTGKTAAFFFITANDMVQVRTSTDYVAKMIELAGGRYIFDSLGEEGENRSTMNIQMEEFYHTAKNADYLIYNSTIDGGIASLEELLGKSGLLRDFKAVQEGNVWCTTNDMYQQSMSIGFLIEDIHKMFSGDKAAEMNYLYRLE